MRIRRAVRYRRRRQPSASWSIQALVVLVESARRDARDACRSWNRRSAILNAGSSAIKVGTEPATRGRFALAQRGDAVRDIATMPISA